MIIFLLSSATLMFEVVLTRVFSVTQFYHFAFMIVSMALLGTGASGTVLAIFSRQSRIPRALPLFWLALLTSISILGSFIFTNLLPFDSYQIAIDWRQPVILILYYVLLSAPFFFCGMAVGSMLSQQPQAAGKIYAFNLIGSASGCILALLLPSWLGGEGAVVFSGGIAALSALWAILREVDTRRRIKQPILGKPTRSYLNMWMGILLLGCVFVFITTDLILRIGNEPSFSFLNLRISPYKSLSYALQYSDAQVISQRWNSFSRLDRVRSSSFHSLPGLSYRYLQAIPHQDGLFVDGDNLNPVLLDQQLAFTQYLPSAIAYVLHPEGEAVVLEPAGGLEIAVALASGAQHVIAVESNSLIIEMAGAIYQDKRVEVIREAERSFLHRPGRLYDVLVFALTSPYHPVQSGAYSLVEDYRYTVESFRDALLRLDTNGLLVVTRWTQSPPSECLRAFILAVTALERIGGDPESQIVVFRGYNTSTLLIKRSPFTITELKQIRDFAAQRAFDITYAPGVRADETNIYNVIPDNAYFTVFMNFIQANPSQKFYKQYPFDVAPPTDDHPFFNHFYKWSQAGQVLAELGKTWQPFGGAGYFVILALLILSTGLAVLFVLIPVFFVRLNPLSGKIQHGKSKRKLVGMLCYFILIGFAFLLVEIPLIQRFILYLGQPAYSMTVILFSLLLFSGVGSWLSARVSLKTALLILGFLIASLPVWLFPLTHWTLAWVFEARLLITVVALAPAGILMGIPFPGGINWILIYLGVDEAFKENGLAQQSIIPWVWGANGAASVVAAALSALLALSFGFTWVLIIGAICYFSALVIITIQG